MAGELTKQVCCIKYSLMACNAFGIMLGIFVVLFGVSYPEENFPGGYKGKETAGISGFFIMFTLIGYYGAHRQKVYFLVPYSIIIFLFLGGNVMMWAIKPEDSVLDPDSKAVLILTGVFLILMVFALWLAWQEKKKVMPQLGMGMTSSAQASIRRFTGSNAGAGSVTSGQVAFNLNSTTNLPLNQLTSTQQQLQQQALQQQQSVNASMPLMGAGAGLSYYGYPTHPGSMGMGMDPTKQLNVLYQPSSNSYITLPASPRYNNMQGPLLMY